MPPLLEEGDVPPAEDPTPPVTGHLAVGAAAGLASQVIGAAGGTIEANGLRLEFPAGALAADTQVSVTQAPVESADFGDIFTPLTPLYTIDTGDAVLAAPVIVTLPATVPDGAMALAFYYDDAAGTLTPLSPIDADATSITAGAIHFSGIVGGAFRDAKTTADSGFRPGIDDWQFTNRGSYVARGGHCEGQSISAIWYYVVQRRMAGASRLYGVYDNNAAPDKTPTLHWDDSDGIRLASIIQVDPVADAVANQQAYAREANPNDPLTYAAFRAAFALSAEPQLIWMATADQTSGHAMIVYRVTPDRLFVADPNYPARLRTISYDAGAGRFATFGSGANAADIAANGVKQYTRITFVPWRALRSEAALAARWAEFEDNKAGDVLFPKYELEALAGVDEAGTEVWVPLVDGYTSQDKQLKIRVRDPANANSVAIKVFPGTSTTPLGDFAAEQTVDLKDGDTPLGIQVDFAKPGWTSWEYVDFARVTIRRANVAVKIEPPTDLCPLVGSDYGFGAKATGLPATVKRVQFTWDFGNGPEPGQTFDAPFASPLVAQATQAFPAEGSVGVGVILNDVGGAASVELARAEIRFVTYAEGSMDWTLCNHDPTQP